MKKKVLFCCLLAAVLAGAFWGYRYTLGAREMGTVTGPEWQFLTVGEERYEIDDQAPVHGTEKDRFLGIATSGSTRFRIYSIQGTDEYLYCRWDWEGLDLPPCEETLFPCAMLP